MTTQELSQPEVLVNATIPYNDPYFSRIEALVIPTTSATVSAISSLLIMWIILRSQSKLSSTYHIIIFFMSFWDIIFSVSIALTTIPMPTEILDFFPFPGGLVYGNKRTCEAQGFLMLFTGQLCQWSNAILNIYYVCTIRYGISDIRMRNRYLPIMFATAIVISLPVPIVLLNLHYFRPHIYSMNCFIGTEPISPLITEEDKDDYNRGGVINRVYGRICNLSIFIIIVSSMALVVTTVYFEKKSKSAPTIEEGRNENDSMRMSEDNDSEICEDNSDVDDDDDDDDDDGDSDETQESSSKYNPKKGIAQQAGMYIAAFSLSWFPLLAKNLIDPTSIPLVIMQSIFTPLQGSFNAMIFIYHRVHVLRRSNIGEYTIWEAINEVIFSPKLVPEMLMDLSQLEMITTEDDFLRGQEILRHLSEGNGVNRRGQEISSHECEYEHDAAGMNTKRISNHSDEESNDDISISCSSTSNMTSAKENMNMNMNMNNNESIENENESQTSHSLQSQALNGFYNGPLSMIEEFSENEFDVSI